MLTEEQRQQEIKDLLSFSDRNRARVAKGKEWRKRPIGYTASALPTFFLVYGASIQAIRELAEKKDEREYSWDRFLNRKDKAGAG